MNRLMVLLLLAAATLPAFAQQVKIGYINPQRIEREAKRPQRDAENLKKEFAAREQQVRDTHEKVLALQSELEKIAPSTPSTDVDRKRREFARLAQQFEQTRRTFAEDLDRRRWEERQRFTRDVQAIVQKLAVAQKFDLVIEQAVHASRAIDITDQVIKALDAMK
ncbi:MAG: OmpH family outer membrane protein [Betaproteobacteria bacterium]|nr:OmpH family outer membrane protein [Betaproteobacteria bacterium]